MPSIGLFRRSLFTVESLEYIRRSNFQDRNPLSFLENVGTREFVGSLASRVYFFKVYMRLPLRSLVPPFEPKLANLSSVLGRNRGDFARIMDFPEVSSRSAVHEEDQPANLALPLAKISQAIDEGFFVENRQMPHLSLPLIPLKINQEASAKSQPKNIPLLCYFPYQRSAGLPGITMCLSWWELASWGQEPLLKILPEA
ncbi:hypothetical protein VNO77_08575 [Canavalia gladiata]|uniref:Uncharacterized protein n=1 Tax=Canavalia gladiata TaxID=3824 RepID=A0AAN9QW86_CANGL